MTQRQDFETRREHLKHLTDEELYERFWDLANQLVDPLLEMGKIYTTPAVERSILLRMGFSSIEAKPIVEGMVEHKLIQHGAGHMIWRLGQLLDCDYLEAGRRLLAGEGWDLLSKQYGEEA